MAAGKINKPFEIPLSLRKREFLRKKVMDEPASAQPGFRHMEFYFAPGAGGGKGAGEPTY